MLVGYIISEKPTISARMCSNIKGRVQPIKMPAKPQWLLRIPSIVDQLRTLDVPVIDRSVCERIFGVGRRRSVDLMHRFGGYRSGNTILLDRIELMHRLETLESGQDVTCERQRKARLTEKLDNLHRYRLAASVHIAVLPVSTTLPEGVAFDRGRLIVEFAGMEVFASRLYALSQVGAND